MSRNQLDKETSPYLLQHKNNPVHWAPWGEDALNKAKADDKPILLSVGYAACHWCHVMAHESFEDPAIADLMNTHFINIKVDREERPDIDAIYQAAISMLGEHGGWPLTVFLTPDGVPFWGGTYFPPTPRYGRPGFPGILMQISEVFRNERGKIAQNADALDTALRKLGDTGSKSNLSPDKITQTASAALSLIDFQYGGTNGAPKFPQPTFFRFLWHASQKTENERMAQAVTVTLDNLCQGGIYDHLGGGFARYSVDDIWLVPHFEKMLYDNALLVELLAEAWRGTGSPLYAERIRETVDWMVRDLKTGGENTFALASAFDADSEGVEGKFYVWDAAEIDALLGEDAPLFCAIYDISEHGNWEGHNILNRRVGDAEKVVPHANTLNLNRRRLLDERKRRIPPQRDDKVLADWNGMAITALSRAGSLLNEPEWIAHATAIYSFITENLGDGDRLFHTWCVGTARHPAVIDDYANMAAAALSLHQVTGDGDYLADAVRWVATANDYYWDTASGGYFLAANDTRDLIVRTKTIFDNATPSGNGVMLGVLARLYLVTGEIAYRDRADEIIAAMAPEDPRALLNQPSLALGYEILSDACQIVIAAPNNKDDAARALFNAAISSASSGTVVSWVYPDTELPPSHPASGKTMNDGLATAYVCRASVCGLPMTNTDALSAALTRAS